MWSFSCLEPVCRSMSSSNCCFLTCIRVSQEAGQVVWSSISFRIFHSLLWSTVKGFGIVNKAEIDVFLELSHFFDDPVDAGYLISGSSAFSKTSLNIWKFSVHVLLKPGLENFEHHLGKCKSKPRNTTLHLSIWLLPKKLENNECWWGYEETSTLVQCQWGWWWWCSAA